MKNSLIALVVVMVSLFARDARGDVFTNPSTITFSTTTPGGVPGVSAPYPSTIDVVGLSGTISNLTVTLAGINHHRPDDIQVLLVGPTGAKYVLMADAGGTSIAATGVSLTFDDAAGSQLADFGPLAPGTFQPTCVDFQNTINIDFSAPAPAGPYSVAPPRGSATLTSVFAGTDPNGTWSLYTVDDIANPTPVNTIAGGWSLGITTGAIQSTVTTLASTPNPSFTTAPNDFVTFTATVTSNGVPVGSQGTVTFKEGATTLAGPTPLNVSGQASFVTSALSEGSHTVSAFYNGTASLNLSDGSTTQMVNNHTTVSSNQFWNLGLISIPDTGSPSTPIIYPSQIFVSGLTGTISKVSVTLSNVAHTNPDDFKLLLVGPTGADLILLGNVGGSISLVGETLTLDDAAGSLLPDTGPLFTGTFKPSFVASSTAVFPAPAPVSPYNQPAPAGAATLASAFSGDDPNGTWSLYVVDDLSGNGSGSIGAWGLEFTTSGDAATTTTVASSVNPSLAGQAVTFTAKVEKTSDNSAVTNGTVTFREGPTVLAGPVALDAAGTAAYTNNVFSEGAHVISADYSGSAGSFNVSSGDITQTVDAATVVSGTTFCNPAAIQIVSGQTPGAYPSRILVTNLNSNFCDISVTISNLSINTPDDVELLLVSPTGARFVLLSDAGGTTTPVVNTTLVFRDTAAGLVPDAGPMFSGTFLPTDVSGTPASFPAPAPAPPYMHPAPTGGATLSGTFGGSDPNGYWSLYVVDDVLGAPAPNIANGWCLDFAYPQAAIVGGPQSICAGSTTAGLGGNPPVSGTGAWSVEGGGTGTFNPNASTPDATFTHTGGNGPITLSWTLTAVCGADAADVEVTILAAPAVPAITAIPVNPNIGSSGNQASGPSATSYAWSISNGTITSATNLQTITYTAGGSGSVTLGLTVFNASGCSASNSLLVPLSTPGPGDPLPASYTADTTFTDGLGSTTMTLAFDGTNYWSCSGGGFSGNRWARYDASGALLNLYAPGLDFRSVFTSANGTVFARAFNSPIIRLQSSPGLIVNSGVSLTGGTLNSQSSVVLNGAGTEYLAMSSGVVSRWDLAGNHLGDVSLQGFGSVSGESSSPQNRGIAAAGAYWLTYSGNQVLSIWDANGNRLAQTTLTGAGTGGTLPYSFSYCNDKVWIADGPGGTWRGYDIFAPVRVAVLAAESNVSYREDVRSKILGSGDIFEVDIIPVTSGTPVPTLTDLSRYHAVLVFSDSQFNDNVAMGDVLADYVDQGGRVVLATFVFNDTSSYGIQGRLKTGNYLPFTTANNGYVGSMTLVKDLTQHPLLFDVASFNIGNSGYHNSPIAITNGATLVASWSNGQPLVGARKAGPGGVVGLNFFPPSSDAIGGGWDAATDGGRLMANALRWTDQDPPVILTHPVGDDVLAGAAVAFDVSVMGSTPLSLQWRKDGINLPGETGTNLAFTAQVGSAGAYSLVASNLFGVATSSSATLTVTSSTNLTVGAGDRGWYSSAGTHSPGNLNYIVGNNSASATYRNWYVFDIPSLAAPVTRAELRVSTHSIFSPTGSETYQLSEIATSTATLQAGGSGLTNIYNDLGDGPVYATRAFVPGESDRVVSILLNQTLRSAVAAAAGSPFALGGELTSLDGDPVTGETVFWGSGGDSLVELVLTVGTGDQPVVGYFTDNDPTKTGLEGPILNAGFVPLHIGNIATQDFSGLRLLLINERSGSGASPALTSRLPDIEAWVRAGGRLIVHDRSSGVVSPNPFLLGTDGLGTVSAGTANLDLIEPATTLVTAGPFGIVDDTTLDGGNSSAHGYLPTAALPAGARAILSTGSNQVACFSYPLDAGFIYYSTIPLDHYLPGGDGGGHALAPALTDIYTPNVIAYTHEIHAQLAFLQPWVAGDGALSLYLQNVDATPIAPDRLPQVQVYSSTDVTLPLGSWSLVPNPLVLTNGLICVEGLSLTNSAGTFFRAVELP